MKKSIMASLKLLSCHNCFFRDGLYYIVGKLTRKLR